MKIDIDINVQYGEQSLRMRRSLTSVTALLLVEANGGKILGELIEGSLIDYSKYGDVSIIAETEGEVARVSFRANGDHLRDEQTAPYAIEGNQGNQYTPWKVADGEYVLVATPYDAHGIGGFDSTVTVKVRA